MAVISFVITSINALFACLHFHDILSEHPGGYHPSGALGIQPQVASQLLSLLIRELDLAEVAAYWKAPLLLDFTPSCSAFTIASRKKIILHHRS